MKKRIAPHIALRLLMLIILPLLLSLSCSLIGKRDLPTKQYFIINYTPDATPPAGSQRPYPYALQIGRFEVQRIFNRQNIIYRYSPNRIQYYEVERWAVRPDYMIKDMIFKHMDAIQLTNNTAIEFLESQPDYRIEGTVEALEKFDAGDLFYAHLAMTFKMLRVADAEIIWNYSFDKRRQIYSVDMVHTVAGMSAILQSEMNTVIGQLDSLFMSNQTGIPWSPEQKNGAPALSKEKSDDDGLDESAFEIIPEKKK